MRFVFNLSVHGLAESMVSKLFETGIRPLAHEHAVIFTSSPNLYAERQIVVLIFHSELLRDSHGPFRNL